MKKALILAGGTIAEPDLVNEYLTGSDAICVDGGADFALDQGLNISLALGDFDSIKKENYNKLIETGVPMKSFNADKDMTDMELAIEYASMKGYSICYLFGATGTRLDHTFANINLLIKYSKFFDKLVIMDNNNIISLADSSISKEHKITEKKGYNLSLIKADSSPTVSLEGVKWPLLNHKIERASSLTISNKIVEKEAVLSISGGSCFVFLSRD